MSKDELIKIEAFIKKEYSNLAKNKNRPRSLENINVKTVQLNELFNKYKVILKTFENRLADKHWQAEYLAYDALKLIYKSCLNILENTRIIPTDRRITFKALPGSNFMQTPCETK